MVAGTHSWLNGTCNMSESFCGANAHCLYNDNTSWNPKCFCDKGYEGNPYLSSGSDVKVLAQVLEYYFCLFVCGGCAEKLIEERKQSSRKNSLNEMVVCYYNSSYQLIIRRGVASALDPEYFQFNQFTEKSDVYSFGVVLVELLTGKKPILSGKSNEGGSLTAYFLLTMKENRLYDILDARVVKEGRKEEILAFANIAKRCLHLNGSIRPTMKDVVMELDGIRMSNEATTTVKQSYDKVEYATEDDLTGPWEAASSSTGTLSYLHSAPSIAIYHRDIKSTNILLDDKFRAKVSDFGISRSISVDKSHLTTAMQGTFGYLDPKYFQSSQFTEKNDVYSFGVVLVELLTGKRPILTAKSNEGESLTAYFLLTMKENRLFDILDAQVVKGAGKEEILVVALVAKRCLSLNGRKRLTMKEVVMELDAIRMSDGASAACEDVEFAADDDLTRRSGPWEAASTSTGSFYSTV
ncbi:hypothetical protein RHGRI_005161 [Rhododendron griersonianum]|uniref:Protein kinase domain-containing protein n=1 Tax=Rhododendron griersonianum TaxID=479676 RepID=A0AAV6LD42_9ERIC|nr:hypothetical protein RHGRI_005161 [Rhododendron griersonianum]